MYERGDAAGVRYLSRLGDDGVSWAIHEPADLPDGDTRDLRRDDPDLREALELFGLTLVDDGDAPTAQT